jgi:hypothetical protein
MSAGLRFADDESRSACSIQSRKFFFSVHFASKWNIGSSSTVTSLVPPVPGVLLRPAGGEASLAEHVPYRSLASATFGSAVHFAMTSSRALMKLAGTDSASKMSVPQDKLYGTIRKRRSGHKLRGITHFQHIHALGLGGRRRGDSAPVSKSQSCGDSLSCVT